MTAEELFNEYKQYIALTEGYYGYLIDKEGFKEALIEFAKYHVQKALEEASDNADIMVVDYNDNTIPPIPIWGVDSYSILNAYPLENIK